MKATDGEEEEETHRRNVVVEREPSDEDGCGEV